MDEKMSKQSINRLDISNNAIDILKEKEIITLGKLCEKSRKELKQYRIKQNDIKEIETELQLLGLDLRKKK